MSKSVLPTVLAGVAAGVVVHLLTSKQAPIADDSSSFIDSLLSRFKDDASAAIEDILPDETQEQESETYV